MWFEHFDAHEAQETAESREINEQLWWLTAKVEQFLASEEVNKEWDAELLEAQFAQEDLKKELYLGSAVEYGPDGVLKDDERA